MAHNTSNGYEHLLQQPIPTVMTAYCDTQHGWLSVPYFVLEKLNIAELISNSSYRLGGTAYLEADNDMNLFLYAISIYLLIHGSPNGPLRFEKVYEPESFIRSLPAYTPGW